MTILIRETINNFPIIESRTFPSNGWNRAGRVVVVDRGEGFFHRWVVASQYKNDDVYDRQWHAGDYFVDLSKENSVPEKVHQAFVELHKKRMGIWE